MEYNLESLTDFMKEYQNRFIKFATYYVKDEFVAEGFVMESVMSFWHKRSELPADTNVPAYILRSVRNKCLNCLRHKLIEKDWSDSNAELMKWDVNTRIASLENFVPEEILTKEILGIVSKTTASLPEQTRKVFLLSRREGKKNKEIADLLGISEKGVEYHITKANKELREALKDYLTVSVLLFFLL